MDASSRIVFGINKKTLELERRVEKLERKYRNGLGPFSKVSFDGEKAFDDVEKTYDDTLREIKQIENQKNEIYKKFMWNREEFIKKARGRGENYSVVFQIEENLKSLDAKIDKLYKIVDEKYRLALRKIPF